MTRAVRVGLVSDSHGLADPALPRLFARCALVLHAGDVVKPEVLEPLRRVAPLVAVRGNNDAGAALARLPEAALVPLGELTALVVHDLGARERPKPPARELIARRAPELVVHGHSHRPGTAVIDGRLFVNPGSAGPRRFTLPRAAGILSVRGRRVTVELFALGGPRASRLGAPLEVDL